MLATYAESTPQGRRPALFAVADSACNVMAGRAADVHRGRVASLHRVPPEHSGTGNAGRAAESSGSRRGSLHGTRPRRRRDRKPRRAGRAGRLRSELPAAGDGVAARPRRRRQAGRLRLLGSRRASLRLQSRAQRVPSPAPRNPNRVAAAGGGARRGARSLPLSAPGDVADAGSGGACGRGRRARREHLDGQSPPLGLDGLRGRGAGAPGDAVRGLRRQQRRRYRRIAIYPASLRLDNLLTVTSSDDSGLPARGSNWGREGVDLAVPAEEVLVTGFDGRVRKASGSSYAAVRVSAVAACLLAAHPEWTASELKSAILAGRAAGELHAGLRGRGHPARPHRDRSRRLRCGARRRVGDSARDLDSRTSLSRRLGAAAWAHRRSRHRHPEWSGLAHPRYPPRGQPRRGDSCPVRGVGRTGPGCASSRRPAGSGISTTPGAPGSRGASTRYAPRCSSWRRRCASPPSRPRRFGQANSRLNPGLRDTVWMTRAATDLGIVLAHELFHVLADLGEHDTTPRTSCTSARAAATSGCATGSANACARWRRRSGWRRRCNSESRYGIGPATCGTGGSRRGSRYHRRDHTARVPPESDGNRFDPLGYRTIRPGWTGLAHDPDQSRFSPAIDRDHRSGQPKAHSTFSRQRSRCAAATRIPTARESSESAARRRRAGPQGSPRSRRRRRRGRRSGRGRGPTGP